MQEGERINVRTKSFGGMGTILYIAKGEFYPVQVEMDEPDEDGHKIQRITWVEIVKQSEEVKPLSTGITFKGYDDPQRYVGEVVKEIAGYTFKMGQQFILGVITFPGVYKAGAVTTSFYVYIPETMQFKGCMPADTFQIIRPYTDEQSVRKAQETAQKWSQGDGNIPAAVEIVGNMKYEQLSLLDFL